MLEILAQIAAQKAPVMVQSNTGLATAVGIWTMLLGSPIIALVWWIRGRPKMRELANAQKNFEAGAYGARIAALETKVDEAVKSATESDKKLVYVISAFQLVAGELKRLDPDSSALAQAQDLLAMASTGDMAMDRSIRKLAAVRGVGEA